MQTSCTGPRRRGRSRSRRNSRPLRGPLDALDIVAAALWSPPRPETIVLALDHRHVGHTILIIEGASSAAEVHAAAELICASVPSGTALIYATSRLAPLFSIDADDHDTWFALRAEAEEMGVDVIDWFVLADQYAQSMAMLTDSRSLWRPS